MAYHTSTSNLFLRLPSGDVLSSPLEKTRTRHLVLDLYSRPTNLMSSKKQAEDRLGVSLPSEAA